MSIIWSLIIILLLILELTTVNIIAVWYALGASISFIISLLDIGISSNFGLQFFIAIVIGTVLLHFFREKTVNYLKKKEVLIDAETLVGEVGIVTKEINGNEYGEVKVKRKKWMAYADKKIKVGVSIQVTKVEGIKLKVKKKS